MMSRSGSHHVVSLFIIQIGTLLASEYDIEHDGPHLLGIYK
jgi:hypothetical protein